MALNSGQDQKLIQLTEHMRKEIDSGTDLYRMGKLMIAMGEFQKAGKIYIILLITISDNDQ